MATRLRKLTFNEVSLVDRGANPGAHVLLFKRDESPAGNGGGDQTAGSPPAVSISGAAGDGKTGESTMTDEEVKALQDQLATVQAALAQEQEKAKAAEAKVEETAKLAKAEQTRIEKTEAELAALRKSHEEAVEKAETMEFQKRAEADFPYTPGTAVEKGEALRAVHKMADGPAKDRILKGMREAEGAFATLMREVGKAGKPVMGSAQAEYQAEVTKMMQADPKLSRAEAGRLVMNSNEQLAKRYADEREGLVNGN
jgi:hypothetical protein